jgi:uncharacterized protein (UPF0261 family)
MSCKEGERSDLTMNTVVNPLFGLGRIPRQLLINADRAFRAKVYSLAP